MAKDPKRNSLKLFFPTRAIFWFIWTFLQVPICILQVSVREPKQTPWSSEVRAAQLHYILHGTTSRSNTHISIFKTLQWIRYQAGRLLDTTLLMLNKEKTPVNSEKKQRHFMFVLPLCRTKVEVHMSNVPVCSVLWNYSKYSSMLLFCEVPVVPFAEPPSTVTPTMPMGCKSQEWQEPFFVPLQSTKCLQHTGKRGRASFEWGLIPSLRWPHFRGETQGPNLLFTHSNMFTAVGTAKGTPRPGKTSLRKCSTGFC